MDIVYIVLPLLTAGFAIYTVLSELYRNRKDFSFIWKIWKRFRIGMFIQILVLILIVFTSVIFLNKYVPYLHYGWMHLILKNGGNIIIAPVVAGMESSYLALRILPPIFLFGLLLIVPFLANEEEKIFRKGYHTWKEMTWKSICFGLIHIVAGIPISVAFALIIPGMFFAYKYHRAYKKLLPFMEKKEASKEAVLVSTTYHTMMNSILILYLIMLTILYI